MATITKDRRPALERFVRDLPGMLSGQVRDPHGVAEGFAARIAWSWASLVWIAFDTKSQGGTDDAGDSWQPNSAAYLAYSKGPDSSRRVGGKAPGGKDGALTDAQLQLWWGFYRQALAWLVAKHPVGAAKGIAAAIAWNRIKALGGKTKLEVMGNRADTILVDNGLLRRSILPGEVVETSEGGAEYVTGSPEQIYETSTGRLVVGTSVPYAAWHHEGEGNLPERRLWPKVLPEHWLQAMLDTALRGLLRLEALMTSGRIT